MAGAAAVVVAAPKAGAVRAAEQTYKSLQRQRNRCRQYFTLNINLKTAQILEGREIRKLRKKNIRGIRDLLPNPEEAVVVVAAAVPKPNPAGAVVLAANEPNENAGLPTK